MPGGPSTALNTNNSSSSSSSSSSIGDLSHVCERAHERNVLTERLVRTHARQPLGTGTLDCEREREARVHTFMSVTCHAYRNTKHKRTHGQRETHTHTSPDTFAHTDRSTRAHAHAYATHAHPHTHTFWCLISLGGLVTRLVKLFLLFFQGLVTLFLFVFQPSLFFLPPAAPIPTSTAGRMRALRPRNPRGFGANVPIRVQVSMKRLTDETCV